MKILITIQSWCNACQSSEVFSTIRGYLKCAVVHHHRMMNLFYATIQFLFDCGQFVLTGFQNWTLLKFALGFIIGRRILIKVIRYTGHHNACVIRLLLRYYDICTITNKQFLKCLRVHGKTFSAFPKVH